MIVNTAYIYMGRGGGVPGNPVIFSQNEINYKYTGRNFKITSDGYIEMDSNSELMFEKLDLTTFEQLAVKAQNGYPRTLSLTANVIDSSGNVSSDFKLEFLGAQTRTKRFNIPPEFKKTNVKIKFSLGGSGALTLQSAILS